VLASGPGLQQMAIPAGAMENAVDADGSGERLVEDEVAVHDEVAVAQATKARVSGTSTPFRVVGQGRGRSENAID